MVNDTLSNVRVFQVELLALCNDALCDERFEGRLENMIVPCLADKVPDLCLSSTSGQDHSIKPVPDLFHRFNVLLRLIQSRVCATCALCLGSIRCLHLLLKLGLILHLLLLRLFHVLRECNDQISWEVEPGLLLNRFHEQSIEELCSLLEIS